MDRLKYRAHARRQKEAVRGRRTRGRPRHPMNKGNIMRAEVQRFKDAEKSLQDGESNSATNKRMSIPRRRYVTGCQKENVPKGEIGMSERVKARANANLSDILARAREEPSLPPLSNTVSPHRYFLPKKGASHCPKRDKKSKKLSDDSTSQDRSSSSPDVPVNPPGKKTVATADQPGTSSQSMPVQENPTTAESSESTAFKKPADKAESKQTKATADKTFMFEYLMASVNEAMEEHANRLLGAKGMTADIINKIHKKYEQGGRLKDEGAQNHGRREGSGSTEVIRSIKQRSVCQRPTNVPSTPSCLDFLRANLMDSPTQSDEDEETDADDEWALGKPSCSTTTIMSPCGLLNHHAKLQTREGVPRGSQHYAPEYKNPMAFPLFKNPDRCHDRVLLRDRSQCDMPVEPNEHNLQRFKNQRTPSPVPTSKLVSQCPKSVVVDPLHYLERYVGKTQGQGNKSTQEAAGARGGYVNIGEDSYTSHTLPHTDKHKLIHPHQHLGQGSLVDTESYGLVRSGTGHATNTRHEHRHSWQRRERKMHQAYGEGHALEGNAHMLSTAQQDLHSIPQGHQHHNKGAHQSTNTWVQFPVNNAAQQPRPLLNLTDDIFPSYQSSNSSLQPPPPPPQTQSTMPPPPPLPRPPRQQSPGNTENPHTRRKVRDIFTLTPMARQSLLPLVQSEERTAAAATRHQPCGASHSTSRNTRYVTTIWSAKDASKFSQLDQVAPSHSQQKGSVRGAGCASGWGRQCVGGMYCGGCSAPPHIAPQPSHPTIHTKHWQR